MKDWSAAELNRLYRYALALAGVSHDAQNLVQSALLRWLETDPDAVANPLAYAAGDCGFRRHRTRSMNSPAKSESYSG